MVVEFHLPLFRPDACRKSRADQLSPPLVDHKMEGAPRPFRGLTTISSTPPPLAFGNTSIVPPAVRARFFFQTRTSKSDPPLMFSPPPIGHCLSRSHGFRSNHHGLPS